jgi:hypothetical protein
MPKLYRVVSIRTAASSVQLPPPDGCLRSPVMFLSRFRRKISKAMYAVARPNVHLQAHAVAVPQVHAQKWDWF